MIIPPKEHSIIRKKLENSGIIVFPTDTVWGIGCLVDKKQAVERIYNLKNRERVKPLILLSNSVESLLPYINSMPSFAEKLAKKHFPGAITLVLGKSSKTPEYITSGYNTVGIRIPDHPVFLEVLQNCVPGHVLATTSANISGEPPVLNKKDANLLFDGNVDYILDDYGFPTFGRESTVVEIDINNKIRILRQGAIIL